jgi:hypothetical protein
LINIGTAEHLYAISSSMMCRALSGFVKNLVQKKRLRAISEDVMSKVRVMMAAKRLVGLMQVAFVMFIALPAKADQLNCNLTEYKTLPGLTAQVADDTLVVTWNGEKNEILRLRMAIIDGTPTIRELSIKRMGSPWVALVTNVKPEFRVVSGFRRMTEQQLQPLRELGIKITPGIVDRDKWEAFWDAPLRVPGFAPAELPRVPPKEPFANQPGLPRQPEEISRATAVYEVRSCDVKTNGERLEISFPGVALGVFTGRLQYTVYAGSNLIRQEVVAKTEKPSVAYKYDAGLKGLAIQPGSRMVWRDTSNTWQNYTFGGSVNRDPVPLQSSNRLVVIESPRGSIAAFPPPHTFFWAREIDVNLGYDWYRKDNTETFSFGVRQPETEADPADIGRGSRDMRDNFALLSARPGTWQRMPVYFYVSDTPGQATLNSALAYTRGDHFKSVPGYQVMATHFHASLVNRLQQLGSLDAMLPDFEVIKAAGINIYAPIDGGGPVPNASEHVKNLALYYEVARLHSDKNFVIMPNEEILSGDLSKKLGGHTDLLISHPVFWSQGREAEQPLVEDDPKYGKVYHLGSPADLIEMVHRENLLLYMPHPRSKGSTGYPDAIKDTSHFLDADYRGIGFRWGMGLDGSEQRLCDYRCLPLLDDMNNWIAERQTPAKYIQAISEVFQQGPGDDVYANNPVNYVKVHDLPQLDDWKSIIDAMRRGDYFVTSGEVLIPSYEVKGAGNQRTVVADVEWTFPLEFVELVWGDGQHTDRQIISATGLPAFGRHRFTIPFNVDGKKWVRFAAWDSAGNGALVQPVKLTNTATSAGDAH